MAHRLLRDPDADGWERADFPIVCETCLGPNPYVRMQRMEFGAECHISGRPYTKFRWRPGNDARYKSTIICQEVAKAKNVCQVCLLDLDYNLPVQVRDQALGLEDEALPESDVGKEFALERMATEGELGAAYDKARPNDTILKLQRTTPYYQRNRAPICSFFVKGECKRGAECPYRHEMPTTGDLANQNIKDRYFGVNDPVANKMLNRVDNLPKLEPPEDPSITTLFVGNVQPSVTEEDLHEAFVAHGDIAKIKIVENRHCAFVTFNERVDAESAADKLQNKLIIRGMRLKLMWGRPQERRPAVDSSGGAAAIEPAYLQQGAAGQGAAAQGAEGMQVPGGIVPGGMVPPHIQQQMGGTAPFPPSGPNYFNLPGPGGAAYPSMDPQQAGTRVPAPGQQAPKRRQDLEDGAEPKRQAAMPPPQPGYAAGPPPGYMPMGFPPRGPAPRGFPPRGPGMYGPGPGLPPIRPPPPLAAGGVPGWGPPPAGMRPPVPQQTPAAATPEVAGA